MTIKGVCILFLGFVVTSIALVITRSLEKLFSNPICSHMSKDHTIPCNITNESESQQVRSKETILNLNS